MLRSSPYNRPRRSALRRQRECAFEFETAREADRSAERSCAVIALRSDTNSVMSKDCPRLSRLGVLAPAALSVCMDASVMAVPAAGAIVSTVLKELSKAFMLKK